MKNDSSVKQTFAETQNMNLARKKQIKYICINQIQLP